MQASNGRFAAGPCRSGVLNGSPTTRLHQHGYADCDEPQLPSSRLYFDYTGAINSWLPDFPKSLAAFKADFGGSGANIGASDHDHDDARRPPPRRRRRSRPRPRRSRSTATDDEAADAPRRRRSRPPPPR